MSHRDDASTGISQQITTPAATHNSTVLRDNTERGTRRREVETERGRRREVETERGRWREGETERGRWREVETERGTRRRRRLFTPKITSLSDTSLEHRAPYREMERGREGGRERKKKKGRESI